MSRRKMEGKDGLDLHKAEEELEGILDSLAEWHMKYGAQYTTAFVLQEGTGGAYAHNGSGHMCDVCRRYMPEGKAEQEKGPCNGNCGSQMNS